MNEPVIVWFVLALNGWMIWMIITTVRRVKTARIRSEVQMRLIERITTSEQMAAFLGSDAGHEVLQSATSDTQAGYQVLSSLQWAAVLCALGAGLMFVRGTSPALNTVAVLSLAAGVGFGVAAALSYAAANKLGLLRPPRQP